MSFLDVMREVLKSESLALEQVRGFGHAENIEERETAQESSPSEALPYAPGDQITWQVGVGGKVKEGVVDFLHAYPPEGWAFCTLPNGGWTAVNVKYIRKQ